ncbi:MAG: hypothetical protein AAF999_14745 [Pseudomonadota bacterium]
MTKERACANNSAHPLKPVTSWENSQVKGLALCATEAFNTHVYEAQALREQQTAYLDSLPTDPNEAIQAAWKLMHPDYDNYPEGFEEALHLSFALEAMIKDANIDDEGPTRDAALYVADRMVTALCRTSEQLDRVSDILRKPGRTDRDCETY